MFFNFQDISQQLDFPPSIEHSSVVNPQQQPLLDPSRKSVKKKGKHNKTAITTQQQRLPVPTQQQNSPQKQNGFYQLDKAQVSNGILSLFSRYLA